MDKNFNCLSFAFDQEKSNKAKYLDTSLSADEALAKFAEKNNMEIRQLETADSPLRKGEWEIVFWGYISNYDPDNYSLFSCNRDFHLARKCEDGIWRHRMAWGKPVEEINLEQKIDLFGQKGYDPHFYAVKNTEE